MVSSLKIKDIRPDRAFYRPGESVQLSLNVSNQTTEPVNAKLLVTIRHLAEVVDTMEEMVLVKGGDQEIELTYLPPSGSPRGYGIDLCLETQLNQQLACGSTAFDVLEHWTQSPRYGFLTDFFPGRADITRTMESLTRYHINGLQFYDWMYRHDHFMTDQDPYLDPLGRQLSRVTIENLIAAAHERNIAAMPYTAIYAASIPFYEKHQDWALFQANGQPYLLGENFLVYMDPRPDSPWVKHLLAQFDHVLREMDFDGIHLDQYGDPKEGYDAQGERFDLASPLAQTINATKDLVRSLRPQGSVVFNAVNNWPIETVALSEQDIIYIEVWSPHIYFEDLHKIIIEAQDLGVGKPVVLAAYIDPNFEHNARLMDAMIFSSGGGHIELGEWEGMLAEPYFPKYHRMSSELINVMKQYYDFSVRYQELIGPSTCDATQKYLERIEMEGVCTQSNLVENKVWPIVREGNHFTAISFVNLLGVKSPEWTKEIVDSPASLGPTVVKLMGIEQRVALIWMATPDGENPSPQFLRYEQDNHDKVLTFQIPSLAYWDLVVIEWSD